MKNIILFGVTLLTFCLVAAAEDAPANSLALTSDPVYQKSCAKCHGKTADGRHFGGPSLRSEKASSASVNDLRTIITNGKGHMPKFGGKIETADIDRLVMEVKGANQK